VNQPHDGDFRDQRQSRDEFPRPVTANIRSIIGEKTPKIEVASCHPGLWLDKFARPGNEMVQYDEINQICLLNKTVSEEDGKKTLTEARARRERNLAILEADTWTFTARTTGPVTLHLARTSALENVGLCLHSVYGFPYIPGTTLKGMARGYAETVWFHGQYQAKGKNDPTPLNQEEEQKAINAWRKIEQVFGWVIGSDTEKHWKPQAIPKPKENGASIGAVVFYDAWPLVWPKLICDIVNSHHADYYSVSEKELKEDPGRHAPGDWGNPVPAYFLAMVPGFEFDFPISSFGRNIGRETQAEDLMKLAAQWLLGALEHRGAGAKTNTGYGRFQLIQPPAHYADIQQNSDSVWKKATDKERGVFREETFTLGLVSPAFLAGANQGEDDCDLRPSTLRGDLRWWWRTMHAGHLDVATLKKLEDTIWGSAEVGGAVSIEIVSKTEQRPQQFDKRLIAEKNRFEQPPGDRRTTQGLSYLAFGMDDKRSKNGQKKPIQRFYLEPCAQWEVKFVARSVRWPWRIPAEIALEQATDALYLLCTRGGIGAKSRKGFGSITLPEKLRGWSLDSCRESAKRVRQSLNTVDYPFAKEKTFTPSIDSMLQKEIPTPWNNPWYALDQLGFSYQSFAQEKKYQLEKVALGLPRKIGILQSGQFRPTEKYTRYSSPFFFHLDRNMGTCNYTIRVTAFPARFLPDLEKSQAMLNKLLEYLDRDLHDRVKKYSQSGRKPPYPVAHRGSVPEDRLVFPSSGASLPRAGSRIEATLLSDKTKNGGWKARSEDSGMSGHIVNSDDVPPDKKPGDMLTLVVKSVPVNEREIVFLYPTDTSMKHA
jgi:CRISPR-associated protein Cmr6